MQYYSLPPVLSLVLTGVGAVAVADGGGGGWWRVRGDGRRVFILGTARLDGPQVTVAARPEARGSRQVQSLHRLGLHLAVLHRVHTALPAYLKDGVRAHRARTDGGRRTTLHR